MRHKGQYIKTKILKKIKKAVKALAGAKLAKQNRENPLETEKIGLVNGVYRGLLNKGNWEEI